MDVPGFGRNRGPMLVRLQRRNNGGTPAEGIYWCEVDDITGTRQTDYVGLYNTGGGIYIKVNEKSCRLRMGAYRGRVKRKGDKIVMGV